MNETSIPMTHITEKQGVGESEARLFYQLMELEHTFPLCFEKMSLFVTQHLENFLTIVKTIRMHCKGCPAILISMEPVRVSHIEIRVKTQRPLRISDQK